MIKAFLTALQFLTVIPVKACIGPLPDASVFFPLIGALLGGIAVAVYHVLSPIMPRGLLALLVLVVWALLNGGLHEDGLADTFDAFGGGRSREDILRILKDSNIGTFGALTLIFGALIRWQALVLISESNLKQILIASQVLPRAGIVLLAYTTRSATAGLGASFGDALTRRHALAAAGLALLITVPLLRWKVSLFIGVCLALILFLRSYFQKKIGGITGDCLGAANQLQETAILVLAACL